MANNLIHSLAPAERLFLFLILGANGVVWLTIMYGICHLFSWSAPTWAYMLAWAGVTLFGLWLLGRLHDAKVARGDE